MADFFFKISPNITVGTHTISRLGHTVSRWLDKTEKRFMLAVDPVLKDFGVVDKAVQSLEEKGIEVFIFDDIPSAESAVLENALSLARGACICGVISLGGLKTASIGRAVSALYNESGNIYDYIEGAQPLAAPLPFIEIPSTCRDPAMFMDKTPVVDSRNKQAVLMKIQNDVCKAVIMDPNLYMHISPNIESAMMFQAALLAFEGYVSTKANFFSDTILGKALEILFLGLDEERSKISGSSPEMLAAQGGCMASLGASISSPGTGTALALACNARFKTSIPLVSAILFPHIVDDASHAKVAQVATVGKILGIAIAGQSDGDIASRTADEVRKRLAVCGLPVRLKDLKLSIEQLATAVEDASLMDIMNYIPRSMSSDDLFDLVKRAY